MAMNTSPLLVNIPNFLWFFPFMLHKNDHRVRQNHQSASPPNSGLKVFAAKQINHTTLSPTSQIACPEKDQELKLWEATGCFLGICLQICIQFYVYNHNIHYYIHLSYVIDKIWWNLMKSINMYIYIYIERDQDLDIWDIQLFSGVLLGTPKIVRSRACHVKPLPGFQRRTLRRLLWGHVWPFRGRLNGRSTLHGLPNGSKNILNVIHQWIFMGCKFWDNPIYNSGSHPGAGLGTLVDKLGYWGWG